MKLSRVLIAGTSSGSGKTTAVSALLALLLRRNIEVFAYKCGPDYIDPMFHRAVSGVPCANLDPFFCDEDLLRAQLCRAGGARLALIEGVMGYYDGAGKDGTAYSTFTVAKATRSPVILTVDAGGAAASLLATIEGFLRFVPESRIAGVLFNRATKGQYAMLKRWVSEHFGGKVIPVGYIPLLPEDCRIPQRHLGLVTAAEITDLAAKIEKIADICAETVDTDAILSLADLAPEIDCQPPRTPRFASVRLAVARDNAFCFYYDDTLRLFSEMGAELCFFSPLSDEPLPKDCDGLLLGGGYPELYADTLAKNLRAKESVRAAVCAGMPTIAECGGFQYLGVELAGKKMCGALPHVSFDTGKLVRFGYITLTAKHGGLLGGAGTVLPAHEFHYFDSSACGDAFTAQKPSGRAWDCGILTDTLYAGYPHLYLPASLSAAECFYQKCLRYKEDRI